MTSKMKKYGFRLMRKGENLTELEKQDIISNDTSLFPVGNFLRSISIFLYYERFFHSI